MIIVRACIWVALIAFILNLFVFRLLQPCGIVYKMCWGLKGEALLPPLGNNIRRRKDARNEMRADVLDYVGFGTMQLRFTIFTKLFHSVQFLTIRQGQLRIRFCGKSNQNRTLKGILPCTAQPFRLCLQEELQPDLSLTFSLSST